MKRSAQKARERAAVILQVRTGQISAKEGAAQLGISRKTYYQWEKRGLEAMMAQLEEQEPGRPARPEEPELEALRRKLATAQARLKAAEQTAQLRSILLALRQKEEKRDLKKKKPRSRKC